MKSLEPLADYLESRFGNIYADGLTVEVDHIDVRPWTAELKEAVEQYLVREVADDDYARFLRIVEVDVPDGSRGQQARVIVEHLLPWHICNAFHRAAVRAISTLDELIGKYESWENNDRREDVADWLDDHATSGQLAELAEYTNHPERGHPVFDDYSPEPTGWHFAWKLSPGKLLQAWRQVIGPARTDLTDTEWQLLAPLLAPRRRPFTADELASARAAVDGMRYKFANDVPWSHIPGRYGSWLRIYERYIRYKGRESFAHARGEIQGKPEVERLVEWLTTVDAEAGTSDVRAWARTNGHTIGRRGRLPKALVRQYRQTRLAA